MSISEHHFAILVSQEHSEITYHLLDAFQSELEAKEMRVSCDLIHVPAVSTFPYAIHQTVKDKNYAGVLAIGCFMGGGRQALMNAVLSKCLDVSETYNLPFLQLFIEGINLSDLREQIFSRDAKHSSDAVQQLLDVMAFA